MCTSNALITSTLRISWTSCHSHITPCESL